MKKRMIMLLVLAVLLSGCGSGASVTYRRSADSSEAAADAVSAAPIPQAPVAAAQQMQESAIAEDAASSECVYGVTTSGMSCFAFSREEKYYSDEAGTQLLLEQLDRASFCSADETLNEWVNTILSDKYVSDLRYSEELFGYAQKDLADFGEDYFYTYSHYVSMGVARHDSQVASLLSLSSVYSGGAHPNSVQTAYNLDLVNLRELKLEDIIYEDAADELCRLVQEKVQVKFASLGDGALFDDYKTTIQNVMNYGSMTSYWYFNREGLVVFFNQYELAPYAAGIIKAQITYEELENILLPEFYPQENLKSKLSGVSELSEPAPGTQVFTAYFGEGESRYFAAKNTIYCVQISEVYFVDDTPVGQTMVLSADYIDATVTLEVVGDFTDPNRTYAISFLNTAGENCVLYIRTDGVSYEFSIADG